MGMLGLFIEHYLQRARDLRNNPCLLLCSNSVPKNPDIDVWHIRVSLRSPLLGIGLEPLPEVVETRSDAVFGGG